MGPSKALHALSVPITQLLAAKKWIRVLRWNKQKEIATRILSGEIQPNLGCSIIAQLCQENNWPNELQVFDLLAHEQEGHEHIGITAESSIPAIIEACRELTGSHS